MESFLMSFLSMLVALAVVLVIAWLALRVLRSRLQPGASRGGRGAGKGSDDEALRFVRALPLGAKERVVLIEHRGERWLLGVGGGAISTIAHWPAAAAADAIAASIRSDPS